METNVNRDKISKIGHSSTSTSGVFNNDRLVNIGSPSNILPSTLSWLLTQGFFLTMIKKYLKDRHVSCMSEWTYKAIKELRLTCKEIRKAVFEFLPHVLTIEGGKENIWIYLNEWKEPLSFPSDLCLKLIVSDETSLLQLLNDVANDNKWRQYASKRDVKVIDISPIKDVDSIISKIPSNIEKLECGTIESNTTRDLSSFMNLKELCVKGDINGTLKVPASLLKFTCTTITNLIGLDLRHCSQLSSVRAFAIWSEIQFPSSIRSFKCTSINRVTLDFSHCIHLLKFKVSRLKEMPKLSSSVKYFEYGMINDHDFLDVSSCHHFTLVKTERFNGSLARLKLGPNVTHFESLEIGPDTDTLLDLTDYNLVSVKGGEISGTLRLPSSVDNFEARNIYGKAVVDFKNCSGLTAMKVRDIYSSLQLPASLRTFTCRDLKYNIPFGLLDLSCCSHLTTVTMGAIGGHVQLPLNIVEFKCKNIEYSSFLEKIAVDLSKYSQLKTVTIEEVGRGINLPPSVINFSCRRIEKNAILDLRNCHNLKSLKVEKFQGKLILSRQYHSLLIKGPNKNIEWVD